MSVTLRTTPSRLSIALTNCESLSVRIGSAARPGGVNIPRCSFTNETSGVGAEARRSPTTSCLRRHRGRARPAPRRMHPVRSQGPVSTQGGRKPACAASRAVLARKWRRTNYFQRLRSGSRNIAGRTLGEAAAAATELCFSIRCEVLDYEHDQRAGDHG